MVLVGVVSGTEPNHRGRGMAVEADSSNDSLLQEGMANFPNSYHVGVNNTKMVHYYMS